VPVGRQAIGDLYFNRFQGAGFHHAIIDVNSLIFSLMLPKLPIAEDQFACYKLILNK
jgi:hypothetical protein